MNSNGSGGGPSKFGSLESQAERIQQHHDEDSSNQHQMMELSDDVKAALNERERMEQELEEKYRAKQMAVPTADREVRQYLRKLKQPITLFGEGPPERRDRLRSILARAEAEGTLSVLETQQKTQKPEKQEEAPPPDEIFYTEGTQELRKARLFIAQYSLPRAQKRIQEQKEKAKERQQRQNEAKEKYDIDKEDQKKLKENIKRFENAGSQVGDDRPVNCCCMLPVERFGEHSYGIVTGSWTGGIRLWQLPHNSDKYQHYRAHPERVTSLAASPDYNSKIAFASGSADNTVKLWSTESKKPIGVLSDHADRLGKIDFHPSGRYLAAPSFDETWRLWDLETQKCLLEQEGHARPAYACNFHPDGSLIATSDIGGILRVWDLRTGKSILAFNDHIKVVTSLSFSPNGYHLASGSGDHSAKIWDLRKKSCIYTIANHLKLISNVKYEPTNGDWLMLSSFDWKLSLWNGKTFSHISSLIGHEGRVMSSDISSDSSMIVSTCYDRTWKWWQKEGEIEEDVEMKDAD